MMQVGKGDPTVAANGGGASAALAPPCPYAVPQLLREAEAFLGRPKEGDNLAEAKSRLEQVASWGGDANGVTELLLGRLAVFEGDNQAAVPHLERALQARPQDEDLKNLIAKVRTDIDIRIDKVDGPIARPDPGLLSRPVLAQPGVVRPPETYRLPTQGSFLGAAMGKTAKVNGALVGAAFDFLSKAVYGFSTDMPKIWAAATDLNNKLNSQTGLQRLLNAIKTDMGYSLSRNELLSEQLQDVNPDQSIGGAPLGQVKLREFYLYRSADGSFTTANPREGAAWTPVQWMGEKDMAVTRKNRVNDPNLPNPTEVSRLLLHAIDSNRKLAPMLSPRAIQWIQAQLHGWVLHANADETQAKMLEFELSPEHPIRKATGQQTMLVQATQPNELEPGAPHFLNTISAWWDGNQIYGSNQTTQDRLRTDPKTGKFEPWGKLHLDTDSHLPLNPLTGRADTGVDLNMWVGLEAQHETFVRGHNWICDQLRAEYEATSKDPEKRYLPGLDGGRQTKLTNDDFFNLARLINSALMAKFHTIEWTPAVLSSKPLAIGMRTNWVGLFEVLANPTFEDQHPENMWSKLFDHPALAGFLGSTRNNHNVIYNFPEAFSEVYRLHPGMPDYLKLVSTDGKTELGQVEIGASREGQAHELLKKYGTDTVMYSLSRGHMPALVERNNPQFMKNMAAFRGESAIDLGAIDIIRARERGERLYNEFRRDLGMPEISSIRELLTDPETKKVADEDLPLLAAAEKLYGTGKEGAEKLDLQIGMLMDRNRPLRGFDQVRFKVFLMAASHRLEADPWFSREKLNQNYYSKKGMDILKNVYYKDYLTAIYPSLSESLKNVDNPFEPVDDPAPSAHFLTSENLDQHRRDVPKTRLEKTVRVATDLFSKAQDAVAAALPENQ